MRPFVNLFFCLLPVLAFFGCSDDCADSFSASDIVAYRGVVNGQSVFTLTKPGLADVITYTASGEVLDSEKVKVGQRVMLDYTPADGRAPYTSGAVSVNGCYLISNGEMRTGRGDDLIVENAEPVFLQSVWLSESFLNLNVKLPYDDEARLLSLVLDLDSPDPECPDLYLFHRRQNDGQSFMRRYYVSYDISRLLAESSVKAFTLHLDNSNLPTTVFKIQIPVADE